MVGLMDGPRSDTTTSAAGVASAVDTVAASPQVSAGTYTFSADAVRIGPEAVALRRAKTVTNERFDDRITPVPSGTLLWELLCGARPDHLFDTVDEFEHAIDRAQAREPEWRTDVETIRIRPVRWRGIETTLVGT